MQYFYTCDIFEKGVSVPYQVHDAVPAPGNSIHQFYWVLVCLDLFFSLHVEKKTLLCMTPGSHVFRKIVVNPILDD